MIGAMTTSLSGIQVAQKRLSVSADNVANMRSTQKRIGGEVIQEPYVPKEVQQFSLESGGAEATIRDQIPAETQVYDPGHPHSGEDGMVRIPAVSLEREVVGQVQAENAFRYNARAFAVAKETEDNLLDILG